MDLPSLSLPSSHWTRARLPGPSARCSHSATLVGRHLYLIGGGALLSRAAGTERQQQGANAGLPARQAAHAVARQQQGAAHAQEGGDGTAQSQLRHQEEGDATAEAAVGAAQLEHGGAEEAVRYPSVLEEFVHFGDVYRLDTNRLIWSRRSPRGARFPPRRGHSACLHGRRIIVFGGTSGGSGAAGTRGDLWMLHLCDEVAENEGEVEPRNFGMQERVEDGEAEAENGTVGEAGAGTLLCVRACGTSAEHDDGSNDGEEGALSTERWEQVKAAGHLPARRRGHSAMISSTPVGDVMFVVGGYLAVAQADDEGGFASIFEYLRAFYRGTPSPLVHALRLSGQLRWELVDIRGSAPKGLALSSACELDGRFMLFGGTELVLPSPEMPHTAGYVCCNSLWSVSFEPLDVADRAQGAPFVAMWRRHNPSSPAGVAQGPRAQPANAGWWPCPRYCSAICSVDGGRLLLFGGTGSEGGAYNDGALLSPTPSADNDWRARPLVRPTGERAWPAARNAMSFTRVATRLLLFGGGVFGKCYFNDLWAYTDPTVLRRAPLLPPPPLSQSHLAPHLASLVGSRWMADVAFRVPVHTTNGIGAHVALVYAHRLLLASGASTYFRALFNGEFAEGVMAQGDGRTASSSKGAPVVQEMSLPCQISLPILFILLRFLYTGELVLPSEIITGRGDTAPAANGRGEEEPRVSERGHGGAQLDVSVQTLGLEAAIEPTCEADAGEVFALLEAADALGIEPLRQRCEALLASRLDESNALRMLAWARRLHCERLSDLCATLLNDAFGVWAMQRAEPPMPIQAMPGFEELDYVTRRWLLEVLGASGANKAALGP